MYQHAHSFQSCWRHFNEESVPEVQSNSKFIKHYVSIRRFHLDPIGSIISIQWRAFLSSLVDGLSRWRIFLNIRENIVFLWQLVFDEFFLNSVQFLWNIFKNIHKIYVFLIQSGKIVHAFFAKNLRNFEFFSTALTEGTF